MGTQSHRGTLPKRIRRRRGATAICALALSLAVASWLVPRQSVTVEAQGTPYFTIAFGTVMVDGEPAPAGSSVQASSPRGEPVGSCEVTRSGHYGAMYIYGEDKASGDPIPGMRGGESVSFAVNGRAASASPGVVWEDDKTPHQVNLTVGTADPSPTPRCAFSLHKSSAGGEIFPTWNIHYQLTLQNLTDEYVDGVTVTDTIPDGTFFVSASMGGQHAGGTVQWLVGLPAGGSVDLNLTVGTHSWTAGEVINQAHASFGECSRSASNTTTVVDTTPTLTNSPTATATPTASPTFTATATETPTGTPSPTATETPTGTLTPDGTPTASPTVTPSGTVTVPTLRLLYLPLCMRGAQDGAVQDHAASNVFIRPFPEEAIR